jgi:hypothetical protein
MIVFTRVKVSRQQEYLQVVENYRDGGRVRQRLVLYVGHYDSIEDALRQMPQDRRRWSSEATRMGNERLRREAEALDERLLALRHLVAEHPDLIERDRARAKRHSRRARAAMDGRREALRLAKQGSDQQSSESMSCSTSRSTAGSAWWASLSDDELRVEIRRLRARARRVVRDYDKYGIKPPENHRKASERYTQEADEMAAELRRRRQG